jgi:hypothetical protein
VPALNRFPKVPIPTPASFTFLQSISTVDPSRCAAALRLLSWTLAPYSTRQIRRSTIRRVSMPPVFRLQGLYTLLTVYSLRTPAVVLGRPQRSWDSPLRSIHRPTGHRRVSAAMDPRAVSPAPDAKERTLRTAARAAASGPLPCETAPVLKTQFSISNNRTAPLGFALPRFSGSGLDPFRDLLSGA